MIKPSYESKKCSKCNRYYGTKENNFLCSKCSGIKLNNLKKDDNINFLKKFEYFNKNHMNMIKNLLKNKNKLKNSIFEMIYKSITKKKFEQEKFLAFTINLFIGLLAHDIIPDNIINICSNETMINNINKIKTNILDVKYLLSLEQANELLDIIRLEDQEKSHLLSHSIAKWLMKPWIQSDKFHHSSLCYYGNYGEEPNLKSGFIFKRNHDIFFIN